MSQATEGKVQLRVIFWGTKKKKKAISVISKCYKSHLNLAPLFIILLQTESIPWCLNVSDMEKPPTACVHCLMPP